jgi:hypothetical protein
MIQFLFGRRIASLHEVIIDKQKNNISNSFILDLISSHYICLHFFQSSIQC